PAPLLSEQLLSAVLPYAIGRSLNLKQVDDLEFPKPTLGRRYMLYLHVPFCERLCPYCSFNRFVFQKNRTAAYYRQLRDEMQMIADLGYNFSSLYLGGGTPTVMIDEVVETIDLARKLFNIEDVSCETNPDHLQPAMLEKLQGRVQRLSVGMQSFDNPLLAQMNRLEKYGTGEENLLRLKSINGMFPTLNVDMIFNFPSQTEEMVQRDVDAILESGVNQVTFYPLMTAPSVSRSLSLNIGAVTHTNEYHFYRLIDEKLRPAFQPVSAWCYSRGGSAMIDEYIVDHEEYIGLGSGSFSYIDGSLFVNTFSLKEYARRIHDGRFSVTQTRRFSKPERMRYRCLMDLFGGELDKKQFRHSFGLPIDAGLPVEMTFMRLSGAFAIDDASRLTLTPKGRYLLVVMMREFFSRMDKVREQARMALEPAEKAELIAG
ncbi:MAG: coproporphyrinogen III oxidase family protein, partial [Anaerolineaceae bacterium]